MNDRTKLMMVWPIAGFLVVVAFGVGVIATAAYETNPLNAAPAVGSAASVQSIDVELGDLFIKPKDLEVQPGPLTINVHNTGATEHNLSLGPLGKTEMIPPGESATLEIPSVPAGTHEFLCEVSGHAEGGMKGTLSVGGGGAGATGEQAGTAGMSGMSAKEMAKHDAAVTGNFPAETKGTGGTPLEPRVLADGTKVFRLEAEPVEWETEPGKVIEAWAYNGQVPGPAINADLGDRVRIELENSLPEPTTLHFHGMTVPNEMDGVPAINQDAVLPGKRFVYEFTIKNSGSNMYHSHFNAAKQVPMGLLGAIVVPDPKDPPADVDTTMVLNDGPLGYTLNGKSFPATAPIVAAKDETVRIRYMNEGLAIHPMHLHGMAQTVIAKDGHLLKRPYKADTVLVGPGERYDVLVKAGRPGAWAFHCHVLNHVEGPDGMFGMVTAMIVE